MIIPDFDRNLMFSLYIFERIDEYCFGYFEISSNFNFFTSSTFVSNFLYKLYV